MLFSIVAVKALWLKLARTLTPHIYGIDHCSTGCWKRLEQWYNLPEHLEMIIAATLLLYQTITEFENTFSIDLKWAIQPVCPKDARSPAPHDPIHDDAPIFHALHTMCAIANRRCAAEAPSEPTIDFSTTFTGSLHAGIEQFRVFAIKSNNSRGIMGIKGSYPASRYILWSVLLFLLW
jgi:hypothetical protein